MAAPKLKYAAIDKTIRQDWSKLRKKGVLAVRPGNAFAGGWITKEPSPTSRPPWMALEQCHSAPSSTITGYVPQSGYENS
jgi:hypothetical protein